MKKVLLLMSCAFCFLGMQGETISGTCGNNADNVNYTYDTETKVLLIQGTGDMENYKRTTTGGVFAGLAPEKIIVGEGVTSIGDYAFSYCTSLTDVELPSSLITVGTNAFSYCESLKTVDLPESATTMKADAFTPTVNR